MFIIQTVYIIISIYLRAPTSYIVFLTNIVIEITVDITFGFTIAIAYYDRIENFSNFDMRNYLGDCIFSTL